MSMSIKRNILVTGHSRGIGKSIFEEFVQREDVNIFGISSKECDLSCHKNITNKIKEIGRIDVLINNAAIVSQKSIMDITLEEWNRLISINLTAVMLLCKEVLPSMIKNNYGKIINIGSIAGLDKSKTASFAYTVSKYGIVGLTKQLSFEFAKHNININCVCPSQTRTEMLIKNVPTEKLKELEENNPSKRLANPSDISKLVYFLSTDGADYINGECIKVCGGL